MGDPKPLQDGKKQGQYGYGTRRPLHYIRALRQPNKNVQPKDQNQNAKIQKQTLSSSYLQENSPTQSQAQRNYTGVRPRGFALNLDVPVFDLLNQKGNGSPKVSFHGNDAEPKYSPGLAIPSFDVFGNKESIKDLLGGGNGPGEPKPSLHLSFSVPLSATSLKPSQSGGGHFANPEPENLHFKNLYTELEKQLGSVQTGLKLPILNHTDRQKHKQGPTLKWPILNDITGNQQSQQAFELFTPQPTDGKLSLSPWFLSQPTRPQKPKDKPFMQNWILQKPALNKPTSVAFPNYPDHVDLYNAYTSFIDFEGPNVQPNPAKLLLSLPSLQLDRIPNKATHFHTDGKSGNDPDGRPNSAETQSSLNIHGSLSKGPAHGPGGGKSNHGNLNSNFQLSVSVPIPAKAPNITKVGGGHSNINFETGSIDGGYMKPAKQLSSIHSGSKFPNVNFDTQPQINSKWPVLDLDAGHRHSQEQAYDLFPLKPNDDKLTLSSWHFNPHTSSRQNTQDKPAGLNWALQKPSITKQAPVLPLPKYEVYDASTEPRKFEGRVVDPSQSHSFYHSAWINPSNEGNVQDLGGYSDGTPFSLATKPYEYNQLKPSIDRTQVGHHLNPPQSSLAYHSPSFVVDPVERAITNYELGKRQKEPKRLISLNSYQSSREGPFPHQHPSDPTLNSVSLTTGYRSPKEFPERDADVPILHGKGKYSKLFLNVEDGDDGVDGQTYFTAQKAHKPDKWTGKNMVEMANTNSKPFVNLQASVSVNKNSLEQLFNPSDTVQSHVQTSCIDGVGDCSKPDKYWQIYKVPEFNHAPYAESTTVSAPTLHFQREIPDSNRHL